MSAVLTPTRRSLRRKVYAWFRAIYVRRLIRGAEFDIGHLELDLTEIPPRLLAHRKALGELRVHLIDLENQ